MNKEIIPNYVNSIIKELCKQNSEAQKQGYGPFCAAICNENGEIISLAHNTVVLSQCSLNHAEVNAIRQAQEKLKTYDLSHYNLSICITAEPCAMCVGAIMWSGIKSVYYGLSSEKVEEISGFDEGYKPGWVEYFAKKGINVTGNIEKEICENLLQNYVNAGNIIYKPGV